MSHCLDKQLEKVVKKTFKSIKKANKDFCHGKEQKAKIIDMGICSNRNKENFNKMSNNYLQKVYQISTYQDSNSRVNMLCCSIFEYKKKLIEVASKGGCTEEQQKTYEELFDGITANSRNFCTVKEGSDECKSLLEKVPESEGPVKQENFFLSLIKIFQS